jgi:transposase-like protein
VNPNVLYRWRRELRKFAAKAFPGEGHKRLEESRIAELERKVGRQAMEIVFLRRCLQRVEEQRRLQALTTRSSCTLVSRRK